MPQDITKAKIKFIQSLGRKKNRDACGCFVAEGDKIALEVLANSPEIEMLVATSAWLSANEAVLASRTLPVLLASPQQMAQLSQMKTPQGVAVVAKAAARPTPDLSALEGLCLYLDGVQDPSNLGAILRVADWFGCSQVFLGTGCADVFGPKAVQASMGAFLRVGTTDVEARAFFPKVQLPVLGAFMAGDNVFGLPRTDSALLVLGNEGKGISEAVLPYVQRRVSIPAHRQGGAESLNVAVAAGILCAALQYQQL